MTRTPYLSKAPICVLLVGGGLTACGASSADPLPPGSVDTVSSNSTSDGEGAPEPSPSVGPEPAAQVLPGCEEVEFGSTAIEEEVRRGLALYHNDPDYLTRTGPWSGVELLEWSGSMIVLEDDGEVATLDGVECMPAIHGITIERSTLSSLAPLAGLERLAQVKIVGGTITDLSPLSGRDTVLYINVWNNSVGSLSGFTLPEAPDLATCCPGRCGLSLAGNPLEALDTANLCGQGWPVWWGIAASETTPSGACNVPPDSACFDRQ